jgi:chemotaxis protein MotB
MRFVSCSVATLLAVVWMGCATPEQQRALEFRLHKAETDRDACAKLLNDELAKAAALTERLQAEQREAATLRAEKTGSEERIQELQRRIAEYGALLEKRASEPLRRPEVPVSPLPGELDQALQDFASKFKNRVWYDRGRGALSFANDQLFEPGSDVVRADAHAALYEFAAIAARTAPEPFEIVVVGHTDDAPITKDDTRARHPTNWHLSVHRAIAVKDVLEKAGLPPSRFGVMGYGAERPVTDDRAGNRRVEIYVVRKGEIQSPAPVRPPRP